MIESPELRANCISGNSLSKHFTMSLYFPLLLLSLQLLKWVPQPCLMLSASTRTFTKTEKTPASFWLLFALLFVVASARCYGARALFFRCVRNTFLMASVRGNKNYDLPIVSGLLRMSGRIHGQSLASTRPMLQAWVSTCNFRYVLRKRHWHHHSSPTTSQIMKCQSASFTLCLFVSFSHHCPILPLLFSTLWSTLRSGAVPFHL